MNDGVWLGKSGTHQGGQDASGPNPVGCPSLLHKAESALSPAEPGQGISPETRLGQISRGPGSQV